MRFPAAKQLDGAWSAGHIAAVLKQLQKDPEVDMVLALGYVSSAVAALSVLQGLTVLPGSDGAATIGEIFP